MGLSSDGELLCLIATQVAVAKSVESVELGLWDWLETEFYFGLTVEGGLLDSQDSVG